MGKCRISEQAATPRLCPEIEIHEIQGNVLCVL